MKIYLKLIKFLKPYYMSLAVSLICMVFFALATGALAFLIGPAIKVLFQGTEESVRILPFDLLTIPKEQVVFAVPFAIVAVSIAKGLSGYGNSYYMGFVGQRLLTDLRKKLFDHILRLPVDFFTKTPSGQLTSRLINDINTLQNTVTDTLAHLIKQSFTLFALAIVVLTMDWELALVACIALPLAVYPALKMARRMKRIAKKGFSTIGNLNALLHETISGIRVVKAFGMEGYESDKFTEKNERLSGYMIRAIKVKGISSPLMEALSSIGFAATLLYASNRITNDTLRPENFISFYAAVIMMYQPLKHINKAFLSIQQGVAAATRVFEVFDAKTEVYDKEGTEDITAVRESIELRGVRFSYGEKEVLKGIDLLVRRGEVVALVGSSGSGKTTLVNLIPRFYDVTEGALLIDGKDVRDFKLSALRPLIAVISQDVTLFNDTILKNIDYGGSGGSGKPTSEVQAAAKAANADGFISRLPQGYGTMVGERGMMLSGGERQRLSIARAILKDAPILIMDEATSSLDSESEREVQRGLKNLMEGRTAFVIAHRLSTVKNADKIVVLKEGEVVECGTHSELLKKGGEYSRLHSIQFSETSGQELTDASGGTSGEVNSGDTTKT